MNPAGAVWYRHVDLLLRGRNDYAPGGHPLPLAPLLGMIAAGGFLYGAAMGCSGLRPLQSLYSGTKVPLLLGTTTLLCLPSFYACHALLGLRDDFAAACRAVLAAQATISVCLAALAPVTLWIYASTASYPFAVVFNGGMFAAASAAGQWTLARHYRELIQRNRAHKVGLALWLLLYVTVAIQCAWLLRPFVGFANLPARFLREGAWSNAYVVVARTLWDLVR